MELKAIIAALIDVARKAEDVLDFSEVQDGNRQEVKDLRAALATLDEVPGAAGMTGPTKAQNALLVLAGAPPLWPSAKVNQTKGQLLLTALDTIVNGSMLDSVNHNDDGLVDFGKGRPPTDDDIRRWTRIGAGAIVAASCK
jgi:hypothetical protein